jgi:hypothetical protein
MAGPLRNDSLVCRGGSCTALRFALGAGVTLDADGRLQGVSVNSADTLGLAELARSIPNRQVGVTTVGAVRESGGSVTPSPSSRNPLHCVMSGLTPAEAEALFTPTQPNPNSV